MSKYQMNRYSNQYKDVIQCAINVKWGISMSQVWYIKNNIMPFYLNVNKMQYELYALNYAFTANNQLNLDNVFFNGLPGKFDIQ